jgi:hypothetical protein
MRAIDADSLYEFFKERRLELIEACELNGCSTPFAEGRLAEMGRIMGMLKSESFTPTLKD